MIKTERIGQKLCALVLCVLMFLAFVPGTAAFAEQTVEGVTSTDRVNLARPSVNGALHVEGTHLVDENGLTATLRGVSLHGLTWYPKTVNQALFDEVSGEWGANLIRLPVYSAEYVNGNEKESLALVEKGIEYAIEADTYVLVDWHILEDCDPNTNMAEAIGFFRTIAEKYAGVPNIIYEICNEPNGGTTWAQIKSYASCVIPVIRTYDADAVIVVGTPDYDRDLAPAMADPITGYDNIMYTLHFYAASHKAGLRQTLKTAIDSGFPVFITECGLVESDGDGEINYEECARWFTYLEKNQIPFAVWSLSNKEESSAMIRPGVRHSGAVKDSELTECGLYVRALLGGQTPSAIEPAEKAAGVPALYTYCRSHWVRVWAIVLGATAALVGLNMAVNRLVKAKRPKRSYDDYLRPFETGPRKSDRKAKRRALNRVLLLISTILSLVYLVWRVVFSIPVYSGVLAIAANIILLLAELIGFVESQIHYHAMLQLRDYPLPKVKDEDFPDVDIFIATYNEPPELLRRTIIGCKHIRYPDLNKVHIYLCDDKRRPEMRALAAELGINYFDRPDNKGAKAGNLNHAMGLTSSPYVVTLDADMIPMEDFLLETIPYFVDAEKRSIPLGFIQTPQCFYTYDVFQYNLYAENNIPDEQDFFYRTIEPARTSTNSVIYGGSNTILSRRALDAIGGFYTESITEDFATGMLIESHGFVSLGLPTPHASGMAPASFEEHIQQRTRWGRGVLVTAKKLKFMRNPALTMEQKLSYLSSVTYWFSPIFNMIYILSPLVFSLFGIPVFRCTWLELVLFWLPMFVAQNICLRTVSAGSVSVKWSALQEIGVMPFLFLPILKELFGFSLTTFKVTDKSKKNTQRKRNTREYLPFAILGAADLAGIVRVIILAAHTHALGLFILLYWMFRNLYFLIMGLFLVDGRDSDCENIRVKAAEGVVARSASGEVYEGITTSLTEHSVSIFVDQLQAFRVGERVHLEVDFESAHVNLAGTIVDQKKSRDSSVPTVYTVEILNYNSQRDEYVNALYNRIPTMPQSLSKDYGILRYLLRNISRRVGNIQ